jgi:hypothetical protein
MIKEAQAGVFFLVSFFVTYSSSYIYLHEILFTRLEMINVTLSISVRE